MKLSKLFLTASILNLLLSTHAFSLDDCGFFTNCSTQCMRNGTASYGHFCMFGTVCNPDNHSCEKPEAMVGKDHIGSKIKPQAPQNINLSNSKASPTGTLKK